MPVDSFRWSQPLTWLPWRLADSVREEPIPWTPLKKPLSQSRFALLTTGGLYVKGKEPPFDMERERQNPLWGDPSYRVIPRDVRQEDIGASHLHYNTEDVEKDLNILLPVHRFAELETSGEIGSLAPNHYSVMGYQGGDATEWRDKTGPEIARRMKAEGVDCVLLTPA